MNTIPLNTIFFFVGLIFILLALRGIIFRKGGIQKLIYLLILIVGIVGVGRSILFQVDEGEILVVTQFKKIFTTIKTPGIHYKLPWMQTYTFPKRINSFTDKIEGRSSDGLIVFFEITPFIRVDENYLEEIYKDIARSYDDLQRDIIIPAIRNIARTTVSTFSVSDIYDNRGNLSIRMEKDAQEYLRDKYIILEELQLRKIELPAKIEEAIQSKLEKQQQAEAMEYEKLRSEKEAEIKEIEAKGIARAQEIINSTLTTRYLQHEAIQVYASLADSENKTFIIAPTDGGSTGIPMILGN